MLQIEVQKMEIKLVVSIIYIVTVIAEFISMLFLVGKGKKSTETYMFLGCEISSMLWCISQVCIFQAVNMSQRNIGYFIGNMGICFIGTCWLNFTLYYKDKGNKRFMFSSFLFSGIMFLSVFSNPLHHLYYKEISMNEKVYGTLFYINQIYVYLCVIIGVIIILKHGGEKKEQKRQNLFLTMGVSLPLALNIIQKMTGVPKDIEITPLGFSLACLFVFIAMFRYDFLNINQRAFEEIIKDIQVGVLIFSANGAFSYANRMAVEYTEHKTLKDIQCFYTMFTEEQIKELEERGKFVALWKGKYTQIQKILSKDEKNNLTSINFLIEDVHKSYQLMENSAQLSMMEQKFAIQKERNEIVQKVHDTLGHTLTKVQSLIKLGMYSLEEKAVAEEYLKEAKVLAGTCIRDLRIYINENRRDKSGELLSKCIMQLADTIKEVSVKVSIVGEDGEKYSHLTETAYLCIRELITNCLKYAEATEMEVVIKFKEKNVEIFVFDNGKGCDNITYGNGFQGIKQRIKEAGGEFRVNSSVGEGFQVFISLPV